MCFLRQRTDAVHRSAVRAALQCTLGLIEALVPQVMPIDLTRSINMNYSSWWALWKIL
jgi:hypothetical protein